MRIVARNHASSLVFRSFQAAVYNMGRNSLCAFPDNTKITEFFWEHRRIIRRLRVRKIAVSDEMVDVEEESFTENFSLAWYRWADRNLGRWFVRNFGSYWRPSEADNAYGDNSLFAGV